MKVLRVGDCGEGGGELGGEERFGGCGDLGGDVGGEGEAGELGSTGVVGAVAIVGVGGMAVTGSVPARWGWHKVRHLECLF